LLDLGVAVFVNLIAQIWLALARDHRRLRWLPYASGGYDVAIITAVLALQAAGDAPAALNGTGVWCFYLFAIALTALRHDGRLTLYMGTLAIALYGLLVALVLGLADEPLLSIEHGAVTVRGQGTRLVLLGLMTLLTATLVHRMQRLIEMSGRDSLTGVPNRAWLMQRLPRMFEAARREGRTVTIGLVDLDHFNRVYQELGQGNGDRAIRHLVGHLREMLGEDEYLARIGGQEFVLVLLCPVGSAWERIDRYRRSRGATGHLAGPRRWRLGEAEYLARIGGQEFVLVLLCPVGSAWARIDRYRRSLRERPSPTARGNASMALTFSADSLARSVWNGRS